jgi:hypothetical protein
MDIIVNYRTWETEFEKFPFLIQKSGGRVMAIRADVLV